MTCYLASISEQPLGPLKKDIKALFGAIRKHDNSLVRDLLTANSDLVYVTASAPPKKDDGQSPLQVALKTGNFEIANYLLDLGADVKFMEKSDVNEWNAPALHDAIRASVFSRKNEALAILTKMLKLGADPNAIDSYGNNCLLRALMDCRQFLSSDPGFPQHVNDEAMNRNFQEIFKVLISAGADISASNAKRESAKDIAQREPALAQLLAPMTTAEKLKSK